MKSVDSVKELLLEKSTDRLQLYGKAGLFKEANIFIKKDTKFGWYNGYVETKNNNYFFISYISKPFDGDIEYFFELRRKVIHKWLKHLFSVDVE